MNNKSFIVLTQTVFSSVGGALIVYSSYDDAPGGVLIGFRMCIVTVLLALPIVQSCSISQFFRTNSEHYKFQKISLNKS